MGRHTILIVEDEPAVRELAADVLRDEGYDVMEARDGLEAMQIIDEHVPLSDHAAVVLLDLMLPRVSGLQILERLQQSKDLAPPVVAMSASGTHLSQAAKAGAHATLAKPFELTVLLDTIARYCPAQFPISTGVANAYAQSPGQVAIASCEKGENR
jgi:CheY-like chemotaxis protein